MTDAHTLRSLVTRAPAWLNDLQDAFGTLLRAPLDSSSGTFREVRADYPASILQGVRPLAPGIRASAEDGLALYHQQYWMRLFSTLQGRFPRFSLSLGYWHFNHLASLHLERNPPRHFDLDRIASGFAARLEQALVRLESGSSVEADVWTYRLAASKAPLVLLREALHIDRCERLTFEAAYDHGWIPTATELANLAKLRLRVTPALHVVTESWSLIHHSQLTSSVPVTPTGPPRRLPQPRHWALFRTELGVGTIELSRPWASLLELCAVHTFGVALAQLESAISADERRVVQAELPRWVRIATSHRWWIGLD